VTSARHLAVAVLTACLVVPVSAMAAPDVDAWIDVGQDLAGTHGSPVLEGVGPLVAGTTATLTLSNVLAESTAYLVIGLGQANAPFKGGVFVPTPDLLIGVPTGGTSGVPATVIMADTFPKFVPHGAGFYFQFWVQDAGGPVGWSASNALAATASQAHDLIADPFDALLAAAQPPAVSRAIYSSKDAGTQTFVRNTDCWAASVDLTGLSPWNQAHGFLRAGTLVSPRHIVFAEHYPLSASPGNNEIAFVGNDDVTVKRTIVAVSYPAVDIGVALLDQDVPAGIAFHKVLPQDWHDHMWSTFRLPMLHLDQQEKALVRDMVTITETSDYVQHAKPTDPLRVQWWEGLVSGDSGNPAFLLVGGEAVLVLTHHFTNSGPFYTYWFDEVNTAMTSLGGGYQLTEYDLDAFFDR